MFVHYYHLFRKNIIIICISFTTIKFNKLTVYFNVSQTWPLNWLCCKILQNYLLKLLINLKVSNVSHIYHKILHVLSGSYKFEYL